MSGKGPMIISRSGVAGRGPRIPGVFPSSRFGEQVVSTGIPSLDSYIGGGIPLGSVCIIKDTYPSRYADLVLKCFIAEGATYNHYLYIAADKISPKVFAAELPGLKGNPPSTADDQMPNRSDDSAGLKIAWRYGSAHQSTPGIIKGQKEAKFEFKKKTTAADLGSTNLRTSGVFEDPGLDAVNAETLLEEIATNASDLEMYEFGDTETGLQRKSVNNLIRIGISHCEQQVLSPKFMMGLRSIVRHTNSCAVLTVSEYNLASGLVMRHCERYADYVIRLEVILDDKRKAELGDVDGICEVMKMSSVNTLKPNELPRDLGFSFRNKRLAFQELHIPPEGETTAQRESSRSTPISSSTCGATIKGKSIDF